MRFEGEAREMANAFKFRRHLWLRSDFVDWLEATANARFRVEEIGVVVAMPTTLAHRLDRGYNQCDYLAAPLAKRLSVPFAKGAIGRIGKPARQGGLSEADRRENVIGTFAVRKPKLLTGKTVLLVDDIMTTGSSLSECAAELKRTVKVKKVWCITLARSLRT